MTVTVTGTHTLPSCVDTVWLFDATDGDNEIVIAVDHRPATWLYTKIVEEGPQEVEVEDWQVVTVRERTAS